MAITIRMEFSRQVFSNIFRSDFQHYYFLQDKERKARENVTEEERSHDKEKEEGGITEEEEVKKGESLCQNPPQEDGEDEVGEKPFVWTVAERQRCFYNTDSDTDE